MRGLQGRGHCNSGEGRGSGKFTAGQKKGDGWRWKAASPPPKCAKMSDMPRRGQAWLLLFALSCSCAPGILSFVDALALKSSCPSMPCCCSGSCCRTHKASPGMPDCPMASSSRHSQHLRACTCSVSSNEAQLSLGSHFDLRFDLPARTLLPELTASVAPSARISEGSLSGYVPSPDHPPRASHD